MAETGILNRDLIVEDAKYAIPSNGSHYTAPDDKSQDGQVLATTVQTIQGTPADLYKLWRDVSLFPRWQENVVSVTDLGQGLSHWVTGNPEEEDGKRVEFDSQITEDVPGAIISWRSVTPEVEQAGTVTFAVSASNRGTLVSLVQSVKVPGGLLGNAVAGVLKRSPRQTVAEDLRHFKQLAESGEIPSVKGQPHGPRGISGSIKEWMYGESNPTPPGTSEAQS